MTDEQQIRSLIERWAEAVHTGDLDTIVADHADDIVMFDVPPPLVLPDRMRPPARADARGSTCAPRPDETGQSQSASCTGCRVRADSTAA